MRPTNTYTLANSPYLPPSLRRVCFKGSEDSGIVLCTGSKTHKIQKVETSNTMLLLPPLDDDEAAKAAAAEGGGEGGEVVFRASGASSFQFETEVMAPRLDQLEALVAQCPYGMCHGDESGGAQESLGHDPRSAQQQGRLTFEELKEEVQASEEELRTALADMRAIEIDGRWCSVHEDALAETFEDIRLHIDAEELDIHALSPAEVAAALPACDPVLVRHCLAVFGLPAKDGASKEAGGEEEEEEGKGGAVCDRIALDKVKVATHQAHKAFALFEERHGVVKPVPTSEFFAKWNAIMPGAWGTGDFDEEEYAPLLKGIALQTGAKLTTTDPMTTPPNTLSYLPAKHMSFDPAERFRELFQVKEKWTEAELQPYLEPLECPGVTVASVRLKYTRMTVDNANKDAPPVFSRRDVSMD